ncbi:MAG: hypothetical protein H6Q14_2921 [Bacteroidetes bacterium]|jgi:hypothetical protein|nr:hypothetical protein [Bacteroidota bacterium]
MLNHIKKIPERKTPSEDMFLCRLSIMASNKLHIKVIVMSDTRIGHAFLAIN